MSLTRVGNDQNSGKVGNCNEFPEGDHERGRFRSFLLASLDHFLANDRDWARTQKRGGGRAQFSLDLAAGESRVNVESAHELTVERFYERQWALTLLELVIRRLEAEYQQAGKARQFALLEDALGGVREPYGSSLVSSNSQERPRNGVATDDSRRESAETTPIPELGSTDPR